MPKHHRLKDYFTSTLIATLLTSICLQVWADDGDKVKPLALRSIMQDMGKNMQVITDGISREDWALVAKVAPLIADHPQPPLLEKMRILSFIGSDVATFKGYDGKTHEVAQALQQAALDGDGQGVISSFAALQNSCLACHERFRKQFVAHFYTK